MSWNGTGYYQHSRTLQQKVNNYKAQNPGAKNTTRILRTLFMIQHLKSLTTGVCQNSLAITKIEQHNKYLLLNFAICLSIRNSYSIQLLNYSAM